MLVYIRGAGDIASGIAVRLHRAHFQIVMSDLPVPTAVRRTVAFSEAIHRGEFWLEDIHAVRAESPEEAVKILEQGGIAVIPDPGKESIRALKPEVVVDAILAKRNLGTEITDAPVVIGIGPGFTAGQDCHAVVETMRGHTLGRVIYQGQAIANTGIPGNVGGYTTERVLRAPGDGIFHPLRRIGDLVKVGEPVAEVDGVPMTATLDGMIRGLLQEGVPVKRGMKSGDIDPRGASVNFHEASDKALSVAGGVLEAILSLSGVLKESRGMREVQEREGR